jgi:outer membrane protein assembly factor BamB
MNYDGSDQQFVAALDTETGKVAWQTKRSGAMHENPQLQKAYATPLMVNVNGKDTVVSPGANWLYGYDPQDGKERWKVEYGSLGFSNVSRPIIGHGKIFFSTCFGKTQMLAVDYDKKDTPDIAWSWSKGVPSMGSPLLVGNEFYFVDDKTGIMTCLDAHSGEEIWRDRLGGSFSASPLFADGKIYVGNRDGEMTVLKPGRTFNVLSKNTLDGRYYASPVVIDNALILRTETALYRIQEK